MKESKILKAYADAFQLSNVSRDYQRLANYRDAEKAGKLAGDFSVVLEDVLKGRLVCKKKEGNAWTIGEINAMLDELAEMPSKAAAAKAQSKQRHPILAGYRANWIVRLNQARAGRRGLTPLEHKWLVRIILHQMQFGIGWRKLVGHVLRMLASLYRFNNLILCSFFFRT